MRKTLLILVAIVISLSSCNKGKNYQIQGVVEGLTQGKISLKIYENGKWITTDSTEIHEGKFKFEGKLDLPEMRILTIDSVSESFKLFIENSEIKLLVYSDSMEKTVVSGSYSHQQYREFIEKTAVYDDEESEATTSYKKAKQEGNLPEIKKFDSILTYYDKLKGEMMKDFVKQNPASVVGPYLIISNSWLFNLKELESINSKIDTVITNSVYVKKIKERIELLKKVDIGQMAPEFSMPDSNGKNINLSSYKGKLLLVDFWASWCSPCRAENPGIVKVYNEFHSKGFYILGVSLDKKKESWLKAVADDQLSWEHVSELKGWDCSAGKLYGINSIPANVLVDPEGKIIARNIFGDELRKKLAELIK